MANRAETASALPLDEDGYLRDFDRWSPEVACALAEREGIEPCDLTPERLRILAFLRDYYKEFKSFPVVGYVCKHTDQPRECLNEEFIDPIRAWKIAGLPKPTADVLGKVHHKEMATMENRRA